MLKIFELNVKEHFFGVFWLLRAHHTLLDKYAKMRLSGSIQST